MGRPPSPQGSVNGEAWLAGAQPETPRVSASLLPVLCLPLFTAQTFVEKGGIRQHPCCPLGSTPLLEQRQKADRKAELASCGAGSDERPRTARACVLSTRDTQVQMCAPGGELCTETQTGTGADSRAPMGRGTDALRLSCTHAAVAFAETRIHT